MVGNSGGSVDLYYNNNKKFETTNTVSGNITGSGDLTLTDTAGSSAGPELKLYRNSASPAARCRLSRSD